MGRGRINLVGLGLAVVTLGSVAACATASTPDEESGASEGVGASGAAGPTATSASSGTSGGESGGGATAASTGPGGGHGTSSSSASTTGSGGDGGAGAAGGSGGVGANGGAGGGDVCTVFETTVTCMPGWTVVYVATTGSLGGKFTYTSSNACVSITDVNCNPDSSVGTTCDLTGTTMTVVHMPCDSSPPCTVTFPVICP